MSDALPKLYSEDEVAAAVAAEREACARAAMVEVGWNTGSQAAARKAVAFQVAHTVNAIRARASGGDALAAHTARVRRETLEEAVKVAENERRAFLALTPTDVHEEMSNQEAAAGCKMVASRIRALIGGDDAAG